MKAYVMGNYTDKAFQGFMKDPTSDRKAVVEQLTKAVGGTIHSMDIVRGSYDFIVVAEFGSFDDFAAIKLVTESSGAVKNLTILEAIDLQKLLQKLVRLVTKHQDSKIIFFRRCLRLGRFLILSGICDLFRYLGKTFHQFHLQHQWSSRYVSIFHTDLRSYKKALPQFPLI